MVAVDCEMVEVDRFNDGLARVSIVNYNGVVLLDKFVIPEGKMVTNYRQRLLAQFCYAVDSTWLLYHASRDAPYPSRYD